jgi:hypothetical protein
MGDTPGHEPSDPPSLPGSGAALPTFDDIPEPLRQVLIADDITRLSGLLTAESAGRHMAIRFRDGEIVGASGDGHYAADAIYAFLGWERGRFEFAPGEAGGERRLQPSFSELVLEGCRRLDEARRPARDDSTAESA